jgi:hypothetical protein
MMLSSPTASISAGSGHREAVLRDDRREMLREPRVDLRVLRCDDLGHARVL